MDSGTEAAASTGLTAGPLDLIVEEGAVRSLRFDGVEVLRRIDMPIRDADWRTAPTETLSCGFGPGPSYERRFRGGGFIGHFRLAIDARANGARLVADLDLTAERDVAVNRAGFILLHPLAGVVGQPVEVTQSDGSRTGAVFPDRISPGQPVFDIQGLRHRVGPVSIEIGMEGEVFEMEDQRNWTDASFKTYCRPLARPRPFTVAAGEVLRQRITIALERAGSAGIRRPAPEPVRARMPGILLAHEEALCAPIGASVAGAGLLWRYDPARPSGVPEGFGPVTLELLAEGRAEIEAASAACAAAGLVPARVIALPRAYLSSHQPEGPWPAGPTPADLVPLVRAAFPGVEVGGGMLTNFTEFNRHRPDPAAVDFVTFGTSAIVHAADDASVLETLEALGDVFASARALAGGRSMHLGLISIGMRSNPYGAAVADNPEGKRIAMAMTDPRQRRTFGAAWGVAAAAQAARGGVASYAPAMTGGPLGLGPRDAPWPIFRVVEALSRLAGCPVEITGGASGLIAIRSETGEGLVTNLGPDPARVSLSGRALLIRRDGAEVDATGERDLARFETLILGGMA